MADNNCDVSKWRLVISHLEKRPHIEIMVIAIAGIISIMFIWLVGGGIKEGVKTFTEKTATKYLAQNIEETK